MPAACRPGSRPPTLQSHCQYRCIYTRQLRPLPGDRALAVASAGYTCNGTQICLCALSPVAIQHLLTGAVCGVEDPHRLVIAAARERLSVGAPSHGKHPISAILRMSVTHSTASYTLSPVTGHWPWPAPVTLQRKVQGSLTSARRGC